MASISSTDLFYFNFHITSVFAEYLNDVKHNCYMKLTDNWWDSCAKEFIPNLCDNTDLTNTQKNLYTKVMNELSDVCLTDTQTKELTELLEIACLAFINRSKSSDV